MKRSSVLIALLSGSVLAVAGALAPGVGIAAPTVSGPSGAYAFSESTHDASSGQEGAAAGAMVFNAGSISGTYSANYRFNPACTTCGDLLVSHTTFTGTYTLRSDGSVTIDMCVANPSGLVRIILEGAFSNGFRSLTFLVSEVGTTLSCTAALAQVPNTTTGSADKL